MNNSRNLKSTLSHIAVIVSLALPLPAYAGAVTGEATEWTQIANNIELVALVAKETEGVAINAEQLVTQVETLKTQFLAYQNMIRNTLNLPETIWRDVEGSLKELHGVMSEAKSLAFDGAKLDTILKSELILDPLYKASGLSKGEFEGRYDQWGKLSNSALTAALSAARMTIKDVETEAETISKIQEQGKTVKGQVEAIQVGNELAGSVAHQLTKLRSITATQNEQTSVFQGRWLAQMDAAEAHTRKTTRHAAEIEEREPQGRELIGSFTRGNN
jgi:P-type conjugative transfer protein TrbJ